ncbi:MAG: ABC transporter permease subunit [Desulfurococcales archaeon]|jgi:ABC-type Fe3+ transport system permease subunit|nr:ABC transporter permease subunit [Desulfurococcales archaeon]
MIRLRWVIGYIVPLAASIPMPFLSAYAVIHLFHRDYGIINQILDLVGSGYRVAVDGLAGVAIYQVIHFYPLSHLLLLSYAENIDRSLIEASSNLGGRVWITISSILVPLLRPAIIAVASLVFILSLEDLVGPIAFSRHNYARNLISYQAYFGFISEYGYYVSPRIASYVLVMVIISVASLLIFHRYLVSSRFGIVSPKRIYVDIGGLWGSLARAFTAILLIFTTLPNILVLIYSVTVGWFSKSLPEFVGIDNYVLALTTPYYYRAIINTLAYTAISSTLIMVMGYMASYISMRHRGLYAVVVEILSISPLVIPGVAIGIAYYQLFHSLFRGSWVDPVYIPWMYLLASYTIRRIPYMVRPVEASLQRIPRSYEEASENLGSSPLRTMWGIGFPMSFSSISAGHAISSIQVATEVSTSLILIGSVSVSSSHPSPITPLIAGLIIYDPQLIHRASAILVITLACVIAISLLLSTAISKILRIPRA